MVEPVETPDHTGPAIGPLVDRDGIPHRAVTFRLRDVPAGSRVLLHLYGVVDARRELDLGPYFLTPEHDGGHALTLELPDALEASYRFVVAPDLPSDMGRAWETWSRVYALGVADPLADPAVALAYPPGRTTSVLRMPGAPAHAAWDALAPARRRGERRSLEAAGRPLALYLPPGADRLLLLFDAENWLGLDLFDALDRLESAPPAVVLIASQGYDRRTADLPVGDRIRRIVRDEVLPAVEASIGAFPVAHRIAAGESYGGLAAAHLLVGGEPLVGGAIAQSGSFHFVEGGPIDFPGDEPGTLTRALRTRTGRAAGRLVLHVGSEEGALVGQTHAVAEAARAAGVDVALREYVGGHDYAWWRHGLLHALDALTPVVE